MSYFSAAQQNYLNTVNYNQFWGLQPLNKPANTVFIRLYLRSFNAIVWHISQELLLMRHELEILKVAYELHQAQNITLRKSAVDEKYI